LRNIGIPFRDTILEVETGFKQLLYLFLGAVWPLLGHDADPLVPQDFNAEDGDAAPVDEPDHTSRMLNSDGIKELLTGNYSHHSHCITNRVTRKKVYIL
jgi:hypothetical protein